MMTITQAGERVKQRFFQQRVAQTLVGQRQPERLGHQLQIRAGRGIVRCNILEGEQANGLALSDKRHAKRAFRLGCRKMVAGNIRLAVHRRVTLPAPHGPALVRVERRLFTHRRKPLRDAAHLPRLAVKDVEPARDPRRDIGGKQLRHVNHIVKVLTPLQPLGHARQQLADGPVGIALFFQTLPRQAVFTEGADGLSHIAYLINLVEIGRFNRVILGCQAVHHVAQAHHGAQHAAF